MASTYDLLHRAEAPLKYELSTGRHLYMKPYTVYSSRKTHSLIRNIQNTTNTLSMLIIDGITPRPQDFDNTADYLEAIAEYKEEVAGDTDLEIDTFLTRLTSHNNKYAKNRCTTGKLHYLEMLHICLPVGYPEDQYAFLADDIMSTYFFTEEYGVMPYFYGAVIINKVKYLQLFFANRQYYPETIIKDIPAPTDSYLDPVSKRICSKDTPNAQLRWTRGTILRQDVVYFGERCDFFKMHPKKYKNMLVGIKNIMRRHFDSVNPAPENDAHFARINYDRVVSPFMRKMCYAYNQMMMAMEEKSSELLYALREAGFTDEETMQKVNQFILVWRKKVLQLSIPVKFRRKTYDIHICLRHPLPLKSLHRKIGDIYGYFESELDTLKAKIWTPKNIGLCY